MMKLKQNLISTEDSSKQLNLKLLNLFEKSFEDLKQKSINKNVKKSSYDGQNTIFVMIQELHWEEEPELHGSKVTATKAFQDFIEKKKTQARNLIFDETYKNVS